MLCKFWLPMSFQRRLLRTLSGSETGKFACFLDTSMVVQYAYFGDPCLTNVKNAYKFESVLFPFLRIYYGLIMDQICKKCY